MKRLAALLDARMIELPDLPADAPDEERPQLCLDRGYDYDACRETARAHGYVPHIPPNCVELSLENSWDTLTTPKSLR